MDAIFQVIKMPPQAIWIHLLKKKEKKERLYKSLKKILGQIVKLALVFQSQQVFDLTMVLILVYGA